MRIYLDNSCFNRPYDDMSIERNRLESAAVIRILRRVEDAIDDLVWSDVLITRTAAITCQIEGLKSRTGPGLPPHMLTPHHMFRQRPTDSFILASGRWLASAEHAGTTVFITCDDKLARRSKRATLRL